MRFASRCLPVLFMALMIVQSGHGTGSYIDDTAVILAGGTPDIHSPYAGLTKKAFYQVHSRWVKKQWNTFQGPNLNKIKQWWKKQRPSNYNKTIFYPFSGPDIMNALNFFPHADTYVMFGLEHPGRIPSLKGWNNNLIRKGLYRMRRAVAFILKINFFRTNDMKWQLGVVPPNNITSLIMFFLSVNNYEIVKAGRVAIDARSRLVAGKKSDDRVRWNKPSPQKRIPGVEIYFRKRGSKHTQCVRYFSLNVIDMALNRHSPNFVPFLKKMGGRTTVIKSASYLLHSNHFSKIRKEVLRSDFIVQDDSGVPIRFLSSSTWKVKVHGYYYRPIPLFSNRYQPALRRLMLKKSTGRLPFSYGYNFQVGKSNLITAARRRK